MPSHHDEAEILYNGKYMRLLKTGTWEYATRPNTIGAVGILAITDELKVIFVEQFRIPLNAKTIEIPAGLTGDEEQFKDEPLINAAKRELVEETGYEAKHWTELITAYSSPGMTDECCTIYKATELDKVSDGGGDEQENIIVHHVPLTEVDRWLAYKQNDGYCVDFKVYAALNFIR